MSDKVLLDGGALSAPISTDQPTGVDIRQDQALSTKYYTLKDARMAARDIERAAEQNNEIADARSKWLLVEKTATDILMHHSKDLEVCAWLVEASLRLTNFKGLATSFKLILALIEQYWDEIYPMPDEEGLTTRLAPLIGLNGLEGQGSLSVPMANIHITGDGSEYALWQYHLARETSKIKDSKALAKKTRDNGFSIDDIHGSVLTTPSAFYEALLGSLNDAINSYDSLTKCLEEKCDVDAPPSSNIKSILADFKENLCYILADTSFGIDIDSGEVASVSGDSMKTKDKAKKNINKADVDNIPKERTLPIVQGNPQVMFTHRNQALGALKGVADYFAQHEPHSPLPYLIRRAISWGQLSFPALQKAMISNESELTKLFHLTGIEQNAPSSET